MAINSACVHIFIRPGTCFLFSPSRERSSRTIITLIAGSLSIFDFMTSRKHCRLSIIGVLTVTQWQNVDHGEIGWVGFFCCARRSQLLQLAHLYRPQNIKRHYIYNAACVVHLDDSFLVTAVLWTTFDRTYACSRVSLSWNIQDYLMGISKYLSLQSKSSSKMDI